jgi:hypothetical protein
VRHPFGVSVVFEARVAGGVVDGFAQPDTFAAPVSVPGCAVAPGAPADEALGPTRANANEVQCTVYIPAGQVPAGFSVRLGDRATVPGLGALRAVDDGQDWGVNPFSGRPAGLVVLLGRYDG